MEKMPQKFNFEIVNAIIEARKEIREKAIFILGLENELGALIHLSDIEKAFDKLLSGFAVEFPIKNKAKTHDKK